MRYLDGDPVADHYHEFGIEFSDGTVEECADEREARLQAEWYNAPVKCRAVYVMEWEDTPEGEH